MCRRRPTILLKLVSYDAQIADATSLEYAKVKPHKVNEMMKRIF